MFDCKKPVMDIPVDISGENPIKRVPCVKGVKMRTKQENSSSMKVGGNGDGNKNKKNGNRYHW